MTQRATSSQAAWIAPSHRRRHEVSLDADGRDRSGTETLYRAVCTCGHRSARMTKGYARIAGTLHLDSAMAVGDEVDQEVKA